MTKNRLRFGTSASPIYFYDDDITSDGVEWELEVNGTDTFNVGGAYTSRIIFTIFDSSTSINIGDTFMWARQREGSSTWIWEYYFKVVKVEPLDNGRRITGYDLTYGYDIDVTEAIKAMTFPMTLGDFALAVSNACGFGSIQTGFVNENIVIYNHFSNESITGRQAMGWVAQLAGGYCVGYAGRVQFINLGNQTQISIDNNQYKSMVEDESEVTTLEFLLYRPSTNDAGSYWPRPFFTTESVMQIVCNPLLIKQTQLVIDTTLNTLLAASQVGDFKPYRVELFEDPGLNIGDEFLLDGSWRQILYKKVDRYGCVLAADIISKRDIDDYYDTGYNNNNIYTQIDEVKTTADTTAATVATIAPVVTATDDYIVAQGYIDNYHYIKYNSGWAELFYRGTMSGVAMIAYNNEYRVPLNSMPNRYYPFTLYNQSQGAPQSPLLLGAGCWDGQAVGPYFSTSSIGTASWDGNIISPKNHGTQTWTLCIHIGGYWKV